MLCTQIPYSFTHPILCHTHTTSILFTHSHNIPILALTQLIPVHINHIHTTLLPILLPILRNAPIPYSHNLHIVTILTPHQHTFPILSTTYKRRELGKLRGCQKFGRILTPHIQLKTKTLFLFITQSKAYCYSHHKNTYIYSHIA